MSLPTVYNLTLKPTVKFSSQTFSTFHTYVHDYIQALEQNDNNSAKSNRDKIKKFIKKEDNANLFSILVDHTNANSLIQETDTSTISAVKGRMFFWSTVNFFQNINGVAIDDTPNPISINLCVISQPVKDSDASVVPATAMPTNDTAHDVTPNRDGADTSNNTESNKKPTNGSYQGTNISEQQKEAVEENRQHEALDDIGQRIEPSDIHTTGELNEQEYVNYLCPYANAQARKEGQTPQIPTSCIVGIALAITGSNLSKMAKFNFWNLTVAAQISTENHPNAEGYYEFSDANQGISGILEFCRKDNFKDAVSHLKDKMSESSQKDKENFRELLLKRMNADMAVDDDGWISAATKFINKYNLYEWDSDKTETEGGHADATPPSSRDGQTGNATHDKLNSLIGAASTLLNKGNKGDNVDIQLITPNDNRINNNGRVKITKLPKGKTMVEPIYPDYLTVGDIVPDWIYSQAYVTAYKAAEEKVLKNAGFSLEDDAANQKLATAEKAISDFKEQQFKAWCIANDKPYNTDEEKAASLKEYNETAATDTTNFTDGIYTPDSSSKSTYSSLKQQRASASYDTQNAATAKSHLRYTEDLQAVKAEIQAREGNWNQETGEYIPTQQGDITMYTGVTQDGASFVTTGSSSSGDIERAVQFAVSKKGGTYTQNIEGTVTRDGPNSYDCSSLVYYSLDAGGFPIIQAWKQNKRYSAKGEVVGAGPSATGGYDSKQKVGDVDTIWEDIQKMGGTGWQKLSWSAAKSSLKRGDIVAYWSNDGQNGHTYIVQNATMSIEARDTAHGIGEWSLTERTPSYDVQEVYRYTAQTPSATSDSTSNPILEKISKTQTAKKTSQIILIIGNETGKCSPCKVYLTEKSGNSWIIKAQFEGKGGVNGFAYTRQQGSKITPCGSFMARDAFGFSNQPDGTGISYHKLVNGYNFSPATDDWGTYSSGEQMWDESYRGAYDYGIVIGFQSENKIRASGNTGGNIFYHCPSGTNGTGGCVAVDTANIINTLKWIRPGAYFLIVIKESDISNY